METSIAKLRRPQRRRLLRVVRKPSDREHARRALAILQLAEGVTVTAVAERLCAARSTVQRWREAFLCYGEEGLKSRPRGRAVSTVTDAVVKLVMVLLGKKPQAFGYLSSRWTSELLAMVTHERLGVKVHSSTIRRLLPRLGMRWRRARPTLCIKDPRKAERLAAIEKALAGCSADTPVFYVDEVDIDLNPRIGSAWMPKGKQEAVPTPGKNVKRYLAGALHAQTGHVLWFERERKCSHLFIGLLELLKRHYRRAKKLVLVLDNYIIHKSHKVRAWLAQNPKFELLFQPAYHPWVNHIERLWKALHDTVTRNHRCRSMEELMALVHQFMYAADPFPGNAHRVARLQ